MVILVDTREQKPLPFRVGGVVEAVIRTTLTCGDYAVRFADNSSPPVRFERKGMNDLFGTMTSGYPRFKREMVSARQEGIQLILAVEGTLGDVLDGIKYSQFSGESMIQKLMTLYVRYKLVPVFCESRREMARYIMEYYSAIGREHVKLPHPATAEAG